MKTFADAGTIRLAERLDVGTSSDVRRMLHEAVDHSVADVRIDVSRVEVIDAAGLGVLVGTRRRAELVGVRVVLVDVPPRMHRLLTVTRLARLFTYESILLDEPSRVVSA